MREPGIGRPDAQVDSDEMSCGGRSACCERGGGGGVRTIRRLAALPGDGSECRDVGGEGGDLERRGGCVFELPLERFSLR